MDIYNANIVQSIIEALPCCVLIVDIKGNITNYNKLAKGLYLRYFNEGENNNVVKIFNHPSITIITYHNDFKENNASNRNILEGFEFKNLIIRQEFKGEVSIFSINSMLLMNEDVVKGSLISFSSITNEYIENQRIIKERESFIGLSTELKAKCNIIEILRGREKKHLIYLKDVINNISEGIMVLDKNSKFDFCNKAVHHIFDIKDEKDFDFNEMVKRFLCEHLTIEDFQFENYIKDALKDGKYIKNLIMKITDRKSNIVKYIEFSSEAIRDENKAVLYTIITVKDITEIKKHEMFIEDQTNFIKDLVENVDIPMAVLNYPSLKVRVANKNFEVFTRYILNDKKEVPIVNNYWNHIFQNVEEDSIAKALEFCGRIGKEYTCSPYCIKDCYDKDRFYKIKFIPYKFADGDIKGICIYASDITEEINHSMELENVTKLKDEFFTVISHELRTPLSIIYSSLQLAYNVYPKEIGPNIDKTLSRIEQNCSRLLKLVNNILDISKAEAGFILLDELNFDIVVLTEYIVTSINHYARSKNIELIFDTSKEEQMVTMDKEKYEKILLNLLSNAIKFTPEGNKIIVELVFISGDMYLRVRDTGIGIPEDKIDFIFDRFSQVNSSLSRRAEGTGIGLSLVKRLVEIMGGTIKVKSKVDEGSEFTIMFPKNIIEIKEEKRYTVIGENIEDKISTEFSDIV
ncbi:sensory box histidine kinase [Clostridium putrefaciens]|uniref:histidine kinase n=1 Tax=Clostridium putrefaciens TaxID=99675 RepID=A0A381J8C6_9CLOT|nr:PAS domain-containing sensor histidine kinase [Clostridium putrefaciens]SUY47524.1 sensory box histidine kinase [Clostridium putrefaciens]